MKKLLNVLLALGVIVVAPFTTFAASENSSPLYKFINGAYDESQPVPLYDVNGDKGPQVMIPNEYIQEKEQFRSSWVATIFNIHFPQTQTEEAFKSNYIERLDTLEDWNMNAMTFQVRPMLDAFYDSSINPTSGFFTGTQGESFGFDPLPWMIEETHARGMQYHAWLNPYRVTNSPFTTLSGLSEDEANALTPAEKVVKLNEVGYLADSNFAVLHPELVQEFEGKLFLNPGEPASVQHVVDTVDELVTNYDIDAIHFDDYFYPYKGANGFYGKNGEDREAFLKYGVAEGNGAYADTETDLENWRRDNITHLIDEVGNTITTHNQSNKKAVQFGVSPFGIWDHKTQNPEGSNTPTGSSASYKDQIYADTRGWMLDNKVDYLTPQIYWEFNQPAAPYGELATWWNNVAAQSQAHLYVGHANYKQTQGWLVNWFNPDELFNQMKFNQTLPEIKGSGLYSYNELLKSTEEEVAAKPILDAKNKGIDILKANVFNQKAVVPAMPWLSHHAPTDAIISDLKLDGTTLSWTKDETATDVDTFVIYKGDKATPAADIIANANNIVDLVYNATAFEIDDVNAQYVVVPRDKAAVELASLNTVSDIDGGTVTPEPDALKVTMVEAIELELNKKITEAEFMNLIKVEANYPVTVTTNFDATVDITKVGTYNVKVTVTKTGTTEVVEKTVKVTVVDGKGNNGGSLVTTGENHVAYGIAGGTALLLLSALAVLKRK